MGEIPHSEKMFHLPIEISVYVPSTQDVDKVISKSEMKLRVDEVKKYLATLFGGFSSSSVEGGFLASDGKVVKENVERVVSFAPKGEFEKNKEALVQKASEWATKWGQEAIGLEHEGDLYYVPQKFENGGTVAIREAKEMANSQALEIKHHASELANALKGNPTIEAWVIAKLESASNDLADVTHYLDGRVQMEGKKMATGGSVGDKTVKVNVTYTEQQHFQFEKKINIPFKDFKEYENTGKISPAMYEQLASETSNEHLIETNPISITITPVIGTKYATGGNLGNKYQDNLEELLKEEGWIINYYDNNINDTSKDLATQVSLIKLDGLYSDSHWVKLPSKMQVTFDWLMNKVNTDKVYKSFAENFNKLLKSKGSKLNAYPTTYGIGVFVAIGSQSAIQKSKEEVENLLNSLGISYTTEYSDANWVYRYKISKSKENVERIENLEQKFGQGGQTQAQQNKIAKVMGEFKDRKLHSSSGDLITDRKQAIAIALSEAGVERKMADGGSIEPNPNEVQFIKYRDEEIMYDPIFQEFFVNDVMFKTLQEARTFIDKGAPMSDEIKDAYRRGLFKKGGNMDFERPSYKSNYVASQAQANEFSDENWNMDYENDPLVKAKRKIKEDTERAVMAYATSGTSEIARKAQESKGSTDNQTSSMDFSQMAGMMGGMKK